MWHPKKNGLTVKINYKALSLLELLIATSLGAMLLLLFSSSYTHFHRTQNLQKEQLYLQAEAHQLLHYFQHHIQHIGYQADKRADSNVDLFQLAGKSAHIVDRNCFIAFYDLNQDGCLGNRKKTADCKLSNINNTQGVLQETFGFKLENKEIYLYAENTDNCVKEECQRLLTNCSGMWKKFTDTPHFNVEKLEFHWKQDNKLLQILLKLTLKKQPEIFYEAESNIFIFNG